MTGNVYAKTDKGRAEIATRADGLSAKLRNLLLMIDGQRALDSLPGASDENLLTLLQGGYIVLLAPVKAASTANPAPQVARPPKPAPAPAAPKEVNLHDIYSSRFRRT